MARLALTVRVAMLSITCSAEARAAAYQFEHMASEQACENVRVHHYSAAHLHDPLDVAVVSAGVQVQIALPRHHHPCRPRPGQRTSSPGHDL